MPNQAQTAFTERQDENGVAQDSRDFTTWYHPEDIERLVWAFNKKTSKESGMYAPQVILDTNNELDFSEIMGLLKDKLSEQNKSWLPFIMKPEKGNAHWMAGIIRRDRDNKENYRLFLFNPTGYTREHATKRLHLIEEGHEIYDMPLILSKLAVQSSAKDGGTLNSCGPIAVEFLRYALENPSWVEQLDDRFKLPDFLLQLAHADAESYKKHMINVRQGHHEILKDVADDELIDVGSLSAEINEEIINNLEQYAPKHMDDLDEDWDEEDNTPFEETPQEQPKDNPPDNLSKSNQEEESKKLKELIKTTIKTYIAYNKEHCFFSMIHRHGKTGRKNATVLETKIDEAKTMKELQDAVIQHIEGAEGNTYPHSLKTYLLRAVLPLNQQATLNETSEHFEKRFEELKKSWGVMVAPAPQVSKES